MAHHSKDDGQFPMGKLAPEDEGELRLSVGHANGKVIMDFGKPTGWIGFTAAQAREIASFLSAHADEVER